jgi:ferredoxin
VTDQKWLKPLRVIFSLFIFAGFVVVFSDTKANVPSWCYVFLGYFQFIPSILKFSSIQGLISTGFILVLLFTVFSGRIYCSTLCPLGILQDIVGYLRRFIPGKKLRYKYSKPLNYLRYSILGVLLLSLFISGILAMNIFDPYANFGRIASNLYQPVFIFINNIASRIFEFFGVYSIKPITQKEFWAFPFIFSLSVFILLLWMVYYKGRLYCNTICPVGTLLGILSKISFLRIKIDDRSCTLCGKCQSACKANCIDIKAKAIDETRCISCFNCIQSCSQSSIGYKLKFKKEPIKISPINNSKRRFLKSGLLYLYTIPLVTDTIKDGDKPGNEVKAGGAVSPPGSQCIQYLKDNCVGCQLCISICPGKVLQPSFLEYGFTAMMAPRMDYNVGFCNYECTKCSEVCPTGAILPLTGEEKKVTQIGIVHFEKEKCIVITQNKSCGSCSEHCPTQAVHMEPYKGNLTLPKTEAEICIGCGACEHVCPVEPDVAIFVVPNSVHKLAKEPERGEKIEFEKTEEFPF